MHYPIYFSMGALAAQTTGSGNSFRQRELRFYAELFSNWVQLGGTGATHTMHNTQVLRFLNELITNSHARLTTKIRPPLYRLTRAGVFALTSHLTARSYLEERSDGILVWYFLKSYSNQITENMQRAGSDFSRAHQIEMEQILDRERFIQRQLQLVRHEMQRLKGRISSAVDIDRDVRKLIKSGHSLQQCIDHVSTHYPYELNPQQSFKATLERLPLAVCEWEITEGSTLRARHLFEALLDDLTLYAKRLETLVTL